MILHAHAARTIGPDSPGAARTARRMRTDRGSALIVVLWVVGLMSILLASFAFDAHVEARIISFYKKREKADYLARSGVNIARMLMAKSRQVSDDTVDPEDRWLDGAKRLKKGKVTDIRETIDDGTIVLDIIPEPARRNINNLGKTDTVVEENMERILDVGGIPEDMWPVLIDSFRDWTDENDEHRNDGAESDDYYLELKTPYRAKNGPLDTVGELMLIRGFTRAIVWGGTIAIEQGLGTDREGIVVSGIGDLLTTYGSGKVNINAAPVRVLLTLPGVDELVAGAIIEEREGGIDADGKREENPFKSVEDLLSRLPDLNATLRDYVETDSSIYRITSAGEVGGVRREISCIAEYDAKTQKLNIKRWREQE
jgi:general secretion pathway protein K